MTQRSRLSCVGCRTRVGMVTRGRYLQLAAGVGATYRDGVLEVACPRCGATFTVRKLVLDLRPA